MAIAILAAWTAVTVCMWFAASRSFATVNSLLQESNPQLRRAMKPLEPAQTRLALRYLASEINRRYFGAYGWAQIVLGVILLVFAGRQSPRDTIGLVVIGAMLGVVLVLAFFITPQIVALGRSLDFLPRNPPPPGMGRFGILHAIYTGLDGAKLLAGLVLLARWVTAR
jgi:hypothetical protein